MTLEASLTESATWGLTLKRRNDMEPQIMTVTANGEGNGTEWKITIHPCRCTDDLSLVCEVHARYADWPVATEETLRRAEEAQEKLRRDSNSYDIGFDDIYYTPGYDRIWS